MRAQEILELAVALGKAADPRGEEEVNQHLERVKSDYEQAGSEEKELFDPDRLWNPYDDTRYLVGGPDLEVNHILAGIDIESGELLLADRLRERGRQIDLVLSHHPEGVALSGLHRAMELQIDVLCLQGLPVNVAEKLTLSRISEVKRAANVWNYNRNVDTARLLGIPLLCVHTPADNLVTRFLTGYLEQRQPRTIKELISQLREIPEFRAASRAGVGPQISSGSASSRCGKIWVDMTGGTTGSKDVYARLAHVGIGTLVVMHMPDNHREEAEKHHLNVVLAGHMASDSMGLNLFMDHLRARGIEITGCSGLLAVSREPGAVGC